MTAFYLQVENLKKAIKASSQSDMDNGGVSGMPASYHSQQYQQKAPTTSKTKGLVYLISVLLDVQALNFYNTNLIPTWFDSNDQIWTWNFAYLAHGKFARPLNFLASPLDHCSTYSHMQVKWNLCSEKLRSESFTGKKEPSKMCGFMAQSVKAPNELVGGAGSIPSRPDVFFFFRLFCSCLSCCSLVRIVALLDTRTWTIGTFSFSTHFFSVTDYEEAERYSVLKFADDWKWHNTATRMDLAYSHFCIISVQTCLVAVHNPPLVAVGNTGGYTSHVRKEGHRS